MLLWTVRFRSLQFDTVRVKPKLWFYLFAVCCVLLCYGHRIDELWSKFNGFVTLISLNCFVAKRCETASLNCCDLNCFELHWNCFELLWSCFNRLWTALRLLWIALNGFELRCTASNSFERLWTALHWTAIKTAFTGFELIFWTDLNCFERLRTALNCIELKQTEASRE